MKILKTKKLFTYMVVGALVMALSISCSNEGTTGGGTGGNSGNGGTEIGGNTGSGGSGSGSGETGETEILTPEEGTYDIDYPEEEPYNSVTITVKTNEDSTVQISGNSYYIVYDKNKPGYYNSSRNDFNCKTSDWAKESGTEYKISKSIISERRDTYAATTMDNAEAKWRYTTNSGVKYIELDINYTNGNNPYRAVALKRATR